MIYLLYIVFLILAVEAISVAYIFLVARLHFLRIFTFLGIFLHEFFHAAVCFITHAPIHKIKVGRYGGQVVHERSRLPYIGWLCDILISMAPFFGGVILIWVILGFWSDLTWEKYFQFFEIADSSTSFINFSTALIELLKSFPIWHWKTPFALFLLFNMASTLTPSKQDYKNVAGGLTVFAGLEILLYLIAGQPLLEFLNSINFTICAALIFTLLVYLILILFLILILGLKYLVRE